MCASRGISAAMRNRQRYLQLLRDSARDVATDLDNGKMPSVLQLSTSPRLRAYESHTHLPKGWVETSTARLQKSLDGLIPRERLHGNDLFLCALIHPSFVSFTPARAAVAMPFELTLTGSSSIHLLKEVALAHGQSGRFGTSEVENLLCGLDVEDLVLFNRSLFEEGHTNKLPYEVRMAAATALCGAVTLTESMEATAMMFDRLFAARPIMTDDDTTGHRHHQPM